MNEGAILNSGVRFILLLVVQILLLRQISWGFAGKDYLFIFIYPLFTLLLPFRMLKTVVILLSFFMGLSIDLFYETLGIHAAAATFLGFVRPALLRFVQPQEQYNIKAHPTGDSLGWSWFARYTAYGLLLHLLVFFSVQVFTFVYWDEILLKTLFSFPASYFILLFTALVFNPKY